MPICSDLCPVVVLVILLVELGSLDLFFVSNIYFGRMSYLMSFS
jgi:hypothetical protein